MRRNLLKNFLILQIIGLFIGAFYISSCTNYQDNAKLYKKILSGNHELRKFNVKTTTTNSTSAWYFLVMGGYSSSSSSDTKVRFYFLNYKNEFQLMEMRLDEINVKIDSTAKVPFVKFEWKEFDRDNEEYVYYDITRAIIHCKETDFQPEININDLK